MIGILRNSATIHRAPKISKFKIVYGIINNNIKTGLATLNRTTSQAIGFIRSIKI